MMTTWKTLSDALSLVREFSPEAHIAGGAVRDLLTGRPVRDIDVYVHTGSAIGGLSARSASEPRNVLIKEYAHSDTGVTQAYEYDIPGLPMLNLIQLSEERSPEQNVLRFDFGICQAWFDGLAWFHTAAASSDWHRSTFTLLKAVNAVQFGLSLRRYKRLATEKYQGWDLVIPYHFATRDYIFGDATGDYILGDE